MTVVTLTLPQWSSWLAQLGKKLKPAALRGMHRGALESIAILQRRTSDVGAVNTGQLKRSWKSQMFADGVAIYNVAPYSGVVEYGRRVGAQQPPSDVIAKWAQRKLGVSAKEAKGLGFVIARSIKKRGIKGRPILTGSLPKIEDAVFRGIQEEVGRELAK